MAFQKGMSAVKASLDRSQRSSGPKTYTETNWFYWKAGENKVVRFLTDSNDILVVPVHENVPTHDGKNKTFVCRSVFDGPCELCTSKAPRRDLGYGIAVLREPVYEEVDGQKKLVGYKDSTSTYEVEENGKTVTKKKPYVGIISQGMRNFWSQIAIMSEKFGSLKERDIEIQRQGAGTDTTYFSFALDKKEIEGIDERYSKFVPDIESFLNRIGSEEYYQLQLHGIKPESKAESSSESFSGEDDYEEEEFVSLDEQTTADRLRAKLNG
jgi:hypothetical protein